MNEENKSSADQVTDPAIYFNRRTFLRSGILAASALATGVVYRELNHRPAAKVNTRPIEGIAPSPATTTTTIANGFRVAEVQTPFEDVTHYNNFYEFSTDKEGVAPAAANFKTTGWQLAVEGLVRKPRVFGLDELLRHQPAGRTDLPDALRRGMVDGDSVGGLFAIEVARPG